MILEIISISLCIRSYGNKDSYDNSQYIMHIEGDNGEYLEVKNESAWPTEGYILNMEKSVCYDYGGNLINNSLSYNLETKEIAVSLNSSLSCYLFFDKE